MTGRGGALLLMVFLLSVPVGVLWFQRTELVEIDVETRMERLSDREFRRLEALQRFIEPRLQPSALMSRYCQELERTLQEKGMGPGVERGKTLCGQMLRSRLPRLELALVEVASSGARIRFHLPGRGTLAAPPILREWARWAAGQDQGAASLTAALTRRVNCPILFTPTLREITRAEIRGFMTGGRLHQSYWNILSSRDPGRNLFVLAVNRLDDIPRTLGPRLQFETWSDPAAGLAFVSPGERPAVFGTPFFAGRPRLVARLRQWARGKVSLRSGLIEDGYRLFAGPAMPDLKLRAVSVHPLRVDDAGAERRSAAFLFGLSLFWLTGIWWLVERKLFQRGPRVSVAVTLLATFALVAALPLAGAISPGRRLIADSERTERQRLTADLSDSLTRLDEGLRLYQQDFIQQIRKLSRLPDSARALGRLEEDRRAAEDSGRDGGEAAVGLIQKTLERIGRQALDHVHAQTSPITVLLTSLAGLNTGWTNVARKADREAMALDRTNPLFAVARHLARSTSPADPRPETDASGGKGGMNRDGHVVETFRHLIFANLGVGPFSRFLHYPTGVVELTFESTKIFLINVAITVKKAHWFLYTWLWGEGLIDGPYFQRCLVTDPVYRQECFPGVFAQHFAVMEKRGSLETRSLPEGLWTIPRLRDLVFLIRYLRIPTQEFSEEDQTLYEARLGLRSNSFILAGHRSASHLPKKAAAQVRHALLFMLVLLVLVLLFARQAAGYLLAPLRVLIGALQRIKEGDFAVELDAGRGDEFGTLAGAFNRFARKLREGELLGQYVSSFVQRALNDERFQQEALEGRNSELTVLFSGLVDIEAFEGDSTPREIFGVLETHLAAVDRAVKAFGGEIDKVMGDKILVLFAHDVCGSGGKAVAAALRVAQAIRRDLEGTIPLSPAIGIDSGSALVGILGAKAFRLDFTAIGDTVNLASRLATLAQITQGSRVVLSGRSLDLAPPGLRTEKLPFKRVKGKTQEVEAYLVAGEAPG